MMFSKLFISPVFFWVRHIFLTLLAVFFILFGVQVLLAAYRLDNPFAFIMTFFASNFIILISITLLLVFILRMKKFYNSDANNRSSKSHRR